MAETLIAVVGATGQQGRAVVGALNARRQFKVRALSRNPGKHQGLADEVVEADLTRPKTVTAAFAGAHGVFLVTNFWEKGTRRIPTWVRIRPTELRSETESPAGNRPPCRRGHD